MATYLVTGGCGFIGSHLCRKLVQLGHTVHVLDDLSTGKLSNLPKEVNFTEGDVRDVNALIKLMNVVDGCFHLAAIASVPLCQEAWMDAHEVNVTGTMNVFEAVKQAKCKKRVVYASSAAVYGDSTALPLNETIASPISFYGLNKLSNEHIARMADRMYGILSVGLRLFNVYGAGQNPHSSYTGVMTVFLRQLAANQPITIYGDGKQSRDFIYVGDVVEFFLLAMQVSLVQSDVVNVCSGQSTTIQEIGDLLAKLMKVNPRYIYEPARAGDIYHSLGDPMRAVELLQLKTTTTLTDGLRHLIKVC